MSIRIIVLLEDHTSGKKLFKISDMASNYAPLTEIEKEQLRTQPNVQLIEAWALVRGITRHPEVLQQIQLKSNEEFFFCFHRNIFNSEKI